MVKFEASNFMFSVQIWVLLILIYIIINYYIKFIANNIISSLLSIFLIDKIYIQIYFYNNIIFARFFSLIGKAYFW